MTARKLPLERLPNWPLGLSRELAAAYVGLSEDLFDQQVKLGALPPPRRFGGRVVWSRLDLEAAFARVDSAADPKTTMPATDPYLAALA